MSGMPDHARTEPAKGWTVGQGFLAAGLILLGAGITFPAFAVLFFTVTHLVNPWFHAWSWTVPASGEIAFTFMWGNGVLLAWRGQPGGLLRAVLVAVFIAGSIYLQIDAAHGDATSAAGHILVVVAFFGCMVVGKQTIMRLRAAKGRPDRITPAEWILHPCRSAVLRSRMALWGEPSRDKAQARLAPLRYAIALAQADTRIGRVPFLWRQHLPVTLRYQLSAGEFPAPVTNAIKFGNAWTEAVAAWVSAEMKLLDKAPRSTPASEPETVPEDGSGARAEARPGARPEPRPEHAPTPALKLAASKTASMTASELEPHVSAMLETYGDVSQARVKRDLHVGTDKARDALRLAKRARTVVQFGQR
jgi:hypothetical protein